MDTVVYAFLADQGRDIGRGRAVTVIEVLRDTDHVTTRYAELVAALRTAVFDGAGTVDPALRRAAGAGADVPDLWDAYVAKVRDSSYRITDGDVAALKATGCTEEEIFEMTVAAATGAALHRLDLGLRAMYPEP